MEVNHGSARARVRLFLKLVDEDRGRLVSSKEFTATARARNDSVEAGVEALKNAFAGATVKIMRWIVSRRIVVADASVGEASQ